jgi:transposase
MSRIGAPAAPAAAAVLSGSQVATAECRQVIDLHEQIGAEVTGHRLISCRCGCGAVTSAGAPDGVGAAVR